MSKEAMTTMSETK